MWEVTFRTHVWKMINTRVPPIDQGMVLGRARERGRGRTQKVVLVRPNYLPSSPDLSWSARHRGRPIDKDPPPSWTERISLTIRSSQIRSYHDARIKGSIVMDKKSKL